MRACLPGGNEVGGDEEEVAGGADRERALGPHPPHHRGAHRREGRERRVEHAQRDVAQVLVLRDRQARPPKPATGEGEGERHASLAEQRQRRLPAGRRAEAAGWGGCAYRVDGALEVLRGVVGEEHEEEGGAQQAHVADRPRRRRGGRAAGAGAGDQGRGLLDVAGGRRELGVRARHGDVGDEQAKLGGRGGGGWRGVGRWRALCALRFAVCRLAQVIVLLVFFGRACDLGEREEDDDDDGRMPAAIKKKNYTSHGRL